ncbi:MAG: sulfatase [Kiritimatiellales bacterium]
MTKNLVFTVAGAAFLNSSVPADERPNIIILVSDDHGQEALGCYGNPVVSTPAIDALAAAGTRFINAFCTAASSSPSRSAILTGLHNHANGTYGLTHSFHHFSAFDNVRTLPAMLNETGYRTGRIGKRHYAPWNIFPFTGGLDPEDEMLYGRDDILMSEVCRKFINEDGPFFLYWASANPHRRGVVEPNPLKPNAFGNPAKAYPGDIEQVYSPDDVIVPPFLNDDPETRAELALYYQAIARLDRGIAHLFSILKDAGKYDNTVIIYISDNGAAFPGSKTTLYDAGIKLPCIVKTPESKSGVVSDAMITWVDLVPTILDFAGTHYDPATFHGKSFRSILNTASPADWRDEIYASHTFHEVTTYYPMRVIRTKKYKFIWNLAAGLSYPFSSDLWSSAAWRPVKEGRTAMIGLRQANDYLNRPRFELYDLENDPNEIKNLAGLPEYQTLVDEFSVKTKIFQSATSDPWLKKWEYE